jgi:GH15 family glucan-1,4-alpha-glucosidase
VAGSHTGAPPALSALKAGLANPMGLLQSKVAARDATAALTNVKVPDAGVQRTILWSKLNLADLRRTITQAAIRDTKAGTVYPKPLATLPKLSGIDAAYPDYAEFFGTDGAYATYSLAAAGQWQTAMQHLNTLRTVSQIVNGSTGKVVHEISSTGAVYYGDNTEPGDINETAQFDIAAGLV